MIPAYALYRRSTAHQDLSIEEQREAVRAWADPNGYQIVREFADDASGLDTERRREFLKLMEICATPELRQADIVLCYDVSRFSRLDPEEAGFHEYSLRRLGVRVLYTHEPGANEAGMTGHLIKSLKRVLAHDFSHKLSQVVQRGLRAHAALGHWVGGRPPYGYRRAIRQADGSLRLLEPGRWKARGETVILVLDPVEAQVVRDEIYTPYITQGLGVHAIADRLNRRGIPAPASLRRRGVVAWSKGTIWQILRNPIYRGQLIYGRARYREVGKKRGKLRRPESEHVVANDAAPTIMPVPLWEAAQAKHGSRRFATGRPWHRPYLLSGLIECGHCGKRFQGQRQSRGHITAYYVCGGSVASGRTVCTAPKISTAYLEDAVVDGIQKRLDHVLDRDHLQQWLLATLAPHSTVDPTPDLERRLAETEKRIGRLVGVLADGADDLPSVRARLAQLERERGALKDQLTSARYRSASREPSRLAQIVEELIGSLSDMRKVLAAGGAEERKAIVKAFLNGIRIEASAGRAILRWYRLPQTVRVKLVAVGGIEPPTRGL